MNSAPTFRLRSDALVSLFSSNASAYAALLVWQLDGRSIVSDGHTQEWRPHAKVLLEGAVAIVARSDSMISPWIHGLDSASSGCPPVALVVSPRGSATLLPRREAISLARQANPKPVLRPLHDQLY